MYVSMQMYVCTKVCMYVSLDVYMETWGQYQMLLLGYWPPFLSSDRVSLWPLTK